MVTMAIHNLFKVIVMREIQRRPYKFSLRIADTGTRILLSRAYVACIFRHLSFLTFKSKTRMVLHHHVCDEKSCFTRISWHSHRNYTNGNKHKRLRLPRKHPPPPSSKLEKLSKAINLHFVMIPQELLQNPWIKPM